MAIVHIDYTTIQNKQNSRRFLCIINNSRHYAQKTSALLYIFVHNDGSCAVCTKNDRNVEAFCAKQKKLQFCNTCYKRLQNGYKSVTSAGRLRPRRRFAWFIVLPIYYIRVKELQKELHLELHRARAHARTTKIKAFAFRRSYVSEHYAAVPRRAHKNKIIIFYSAR